MKINAKKKLIIPAAVAVIISLIIVAAAAACAAYLGDYYRADQKAIDAFAPMSEVACEELENGSLIFKPEAPVAGFIFYPGGKVENDAYKPLMAAIAREGVLCVLVEMPFNLAVFDVNAADGIKESYPDVTKWYIGGHSLGGSMAASYLSGHTEEYEGLVLLGSYSTADLSLSDIEALSIFGSEDKVMNREKYEENKKNLPKGFTEVIIDGGCHAYFGMYGAQEGDGAPTISCEEQINKTAACIFDLICG